ncbi:MAG: hypothetical protein AAFV53_11655 [Myxococcota bacterium]
MIDKRSRYRLTPTQTVTLANGEPATLLSLRVLPDAEGFFYATPEPGVRLDHLAERYYRDPRRFWRIADASDHLDPFDIVEAGEPLLIPPGR